MLPHEFSLLHSSLTDARQHSVQYLAVSRAGQKPLEKAVRPRPMVGIGADSPTSLIQFGQIVELSSSGFCVRSCHVSTRNSDVDEEQVSVWPLDSRYRS